MKDEREQNSPSSLKGHFIISESNMSDPNFHQTVVLMLEHNSQGAFGLVVNRKSRVTLADILPDLENELTRNTGIYVGGPVEQQYLFVLHSDLPNQEKPSEAAMRPVPGVIFEPFFQKIEKYFQPERWENIPGDDRPSIHLFLGYSGWAPGQLEREMSLGSWIVHPASRRIVFHPQPEQGWKDALRAKGGIYKVFADSDQDPSLN